MAGVSWKCCVQGTVGGLSAVRFPVTMPWVRFSAVTQTHSSSSVAFIQQLALAALLLSWNGMLSLLDLKTFPLTKGLLSHSLSFGPLIPCDVPAPRNPSAHYNPNVLFVFCFFLLFCCSPTSALFTAHSPVVSTRTRIHAYFHFDSSAVIFPRHSTDLDSLGSPCGICWAI
jgi:hypothetical protein